MSAVLSVSPAVPSVRIGQSVQLHCQVRDSDARRPYDLTGAGTITCKLISLTGGALRIVAGAIAVEGAPYGTFTLLLNNADTTALTAGRWYLQVTIPTVPAEGGGSLIPDFYPFDVVATQ